MIDVSSEVDAGRVDEVVLLVDGVPVHNGRLPPGPVTIPAAPGEHTAQMLVRFGLRAGLFGGRCAIELRSSHSMSSDFPEGSGALRARVVDRGALHPIEDRFTIAWKEPFRHRGAAPAPAAEPALLFAPPPSAKLSEDCKNEPRGGLAPETPETLRGLPPTPR